MNNMQVLQNNALIIHLVKRSANKESQPHQSTPQKGRMNLRRGELRPLPDDLLDGIQEITLRRHLSPCPDREHTSLNRFDEHAVRDQSEEYGESMDIPQSLLTAAQHQSCWDIDEL